MSDFIKGLIEIVIIGIIGIFIIDACDKDTDTNTNLTFKKDKINICNEEIELYDFIDDEEFDSIQFEKYIKEICIENPNKE